MLFGSTKSQQYQNQQHNRRESYTVGNTTTRTTSSSLSSLNSPILCYSDETMLERICSSHQQRHHSNGKKPLLKKLEKRKEHCGANCRRYCLRIMNVIFVLFVLQTLFGVLASFILLFSSGSEIYKSTSGYERWQTTYKLRMRVVKVHNSARTLVDLMFYNLFIGKMMNLENQMEWMRLMQATGKMIISSQMIAIHFVRFDEYFLLYRNDSFESGTFRNTSSRGTHECFVYSIRDQNSLLLSYDDLKLVKTYHKTIYPPTASAWYSDTKKTIDPIWTRAISDRTNANLYSIFFVYPIYSQTPVRQLNMSEPNIPIHSILPKDLLLANGSYEDYLFGQVALEFQIQNVNPQNSSASLYSSFIINGSGGVFARSRDSDTSIDEIANEIRQTGLLNLHMNANESYIFNFNGKVVEISTLRDAYNLTTTIVTTSLERTYLSDVISSSVVPVIVFIVLLVLETFILLGIVQAINLPLTDITKQMKNLISFKGLDTPYKKHVTIFSDIKEMDENIQITQRGIFAFSKYVPHIVSKMIVSNKQEYGKIGLRLEPSMTVMYCGVDNFSILAEKTESTSFIRIITEYYSSISQVIEAHYGIIDKFIEGTVMVFWNEKSFQCANHESRACKTAIECIEVIEDLNTKWKSLLGIQLHISIGITCGEMLVGCLGNKRRMSFTVIGDACNVALQLQSLAPSYCSILVSGEIFEKVRDEFVFYFVDLLQLRGKITSTFVYSLVLFRNEASDLEKKMEKDLEQARQLLFSNQHLQFYSLCDRLASVWSDSKIVANLFERARGLMSEEKAL